MAKKLSGQTFVVTGTLEGFSRAEAKSQIEALGGKVSGSVSANTDCVVIGEDPGSKADKAKKLGIKMLNEAAFKRLLGGTLGGTSKKATKKKATKKKTATKKKAAKKVVKKAVRKKATKKIVKKATKKATKKKATKKKVGRKVVKKAAKKAATKKITKKTDADNAKNIFSAIEDKKTKKIYSLVTEVPDINEKLNRPGNEANGWSYLLHACKYGDLETVQLLLKNGANISLKDGEGKGALYWAACNVDHEEAVKLIKLIIMTKVDVDEKTDQGRTALSGALTQINPGAVKVLLKSKANPNPQFENGDTALDYAIGISARFIEEEDENRQEGMLEIVRLLLEVQAESKNVSFSQLFPEFAHTFFEKFRDKELLKEVYKKAKDQAEDKYDCRDLAKSIRERLDDKEFLKDIFKKWEAKTEDDDEGNNIVAFVNLAESLCEILEDKEWAKKVYKKAERTPSFFKEDVCDDLRTLAESICETLEDKEWAKKVLKKAENKAENKHNFRGLVLCISRLFDDIEWQKDIFKKWEAKTEDIVDFIELAESLCETLEDKEWAKKVYKKAKDKTNGTDDLQPLARSIRDYLGDDKWATNIVKQINRRSKDFSKKITEIINDWTSKSGKPIRCFAFYTVWQNEQENGTFTVKKNGESEEIEGYIMWGNKSSGTLIWELPASAGTYGAAGAIETLEKDDWSDDEIEYDDKEGFEDSDGKGSEAFDVNDNTIEDYDNFEGGGSTEVVGFGSIRGPSDITITYENQKEVVFESSGGGSWTVKIADGQPESIPDYEAVLVLVRTLLK